jgi:hypothetical protein
MQDKMRDTTVGSLKGSVFTLKTEDDNGNIHYRMFLLLYTQEVTYSFQYYYDIIRAGFIKDDVKQFFGSMKLSPELQRNDQYLNTKGGTGGPFGTSQILMYSGALILIIAVVITIIRRRKKREDVIE